MVVVVDIVLNRPSKVYNEQEHIRGAIVIQSKTDFKHDGVILCMEGHVNLQLSSKTVGIFEAFYQSVKPIQLLSYQIEMIKPGKLTPGRSEFPFEFPLRARHNKTLYETYHGVFINVQYSLKCEVKRSFLIGTTMTKSTEFIVEYGTSSISSSSTSPTNTSIAIASELLKPAEMKRVDFEMIGEAGSKLGFFRAHGHLDSVNCPITKPFTGEIIIDKSEFPIKSIEVQFVRVEICGCVEGFAKDASEIQTIQIGEGNVCKGLPIPIYMIFPRLFSCPTLCTANFKIGTETNVNLKTKQRHIVQMDFVKDEVATLALLPERPVEPLDSECCGTGCTPCVFDIYRKQLFKWENDCKQILKIGVSDNSIEKSITPYSYRDFPITDILDDLNAVSVKIFTLNCIPNDNTSTNDACVFPIEIGQHIVIRIGSMSRKYTVLRVNRNSKFEILVKIYPEGPMTQLINKLIVGDCIQIRGPFGDAVAYEPNKYKSVVMLAAGTGLAPMYRIIETILENEEDETKIKLFFSSKRMTDIFLRNKLREWSDFWNFEVLYYISDNEKETKIPYGMKVKFKRLDYESVSEHFETQFKNSRTMYYICGTKSFEKDMVNYLNKLSVENKDVLVF